MVSSVKSRSNHYDTLGVAPAASSDEITKAFAAQMLTARMRPDFTVARMAELSVAYETLRDPAKRRAYDTASGLNRPPIATIPRSAAPFIGYTTIDRLNQLAAPSLPSVQPPPRQAAPNAHVEPRVAGFIADSLRQPAPRPAPEIRQEPSPPPVEAVSRGEQSEAKSITRDPTLEFEDGRFFIGRTGATLGACVIGVAILSVALAVPSPNPDRLPETPISQAKAGLTVPLPPAAADQELDSSLGTAATTEADTSRRSPARSRTAVVTEKPRSATPVTVDGEALAQAVDQLSANRSPTVESASAQTAALSEAVESPGEAEVTPAVAAATMPLPNATVARTIQRIGYACGKVVSTSGVDGAGAGVFKVTCSSGDSYQATPVRGRYHFRRWGSH